MKFPTHTLDDMFGYHPASDAQKAKYKRIEDKSNELASLIIEITPSCADQSAAIRKIREAKMTAIAAIACDPETIERNKEAMHADKEFSRQERDFLTAGR